MSESLRPLRKQKNSLRYAKIRYKWKTAGTHWAGKGKNWKGKKMVFNARTIPILWIFVFRVKPFTLKKYFTWKNRVSHATNYNSFPVGTIQRLSYTFANYAVHLHKILKNMHWHKSLFLHFVFIMNDFIIPTINALNNIMFIAGWSVIFLNF